MGSVFHPSLHDSGSNSHPRRILLPPSLGLIMKRNPGRPVVHPTSETTTVTLKVSREFKERLIVQAEAVDLTLTDYIKSLVLRDGT